MLGRMACVLAIPKFFSHGLENMRSYFWTKQSLIMLQFPLRERMQFLSNDPFIFYFLFFLFFFKLLKFNNISNIYDLSSCQRNGKLNMNLISKQIKTPK